jgi:hypothetical protein
LMPPPPQSTARVYGVVAGAGTGPR